ncbi:hypothetical protein L4D76_25820 [Photobacterium sagamiensis]|uniref:hypothetical protein n=1 Tax=Photobacterium sagamiensis TaxID=2910241 RepID=UPI003D14E229
MNNMNQSYKNKKSVIPKGAMRMTALAVIIGALSGCNVLDHDEEKSADSNSGSSSGNTVAVDITNFDGMLTYSSNIGVDDQNSEYYFEDNTRLKRGSNTLQHIEYLLDGNVKNLSLVTYYDNKVSDKTEFGVYLSKTGADYEKFDLTTDIATAESSDWVTRVEMILSDIPDGYDFVKVTFPVLDGNDELPWNPQLGDLMLDVEANPAAADDNVRGGSGPVAGGQEPLPVPAEVITDTQTVFGYYVTRGVGADGNKLFEGNNEFRFVSFNTPELHTQESPFWSKIDQFETEDAIKSIAAMGGKVTRSYVLSVKNENHPNGPFHITFDQNGELQFNDDMFASLDKAIDLANKNGVRIVIPFIDNWSWWGGITELAQSRGKTAEEFFTDTQLKADYKKIVEYVLNRINALSGVQYKDDPAILAWETGNELRNVPASWTAEMAAYIKSIDSNHLVMDGSDYVISESSISDTNVDIISNHYYVNADMNSNDYKARFLKDWKLAGARKPFVVGEVGIEGMDVMSDVVNSVIDEGGTGIMLWSLRQQDANGGYLDHSEEGTDYRAYHWPGFAANDGYEEQAIIDLVWTKAYEINGESKPELPAPDGTPVMLPIEVASDIRWQGVTNAQYYDVERCEADCSNNANWSVVGDDVVTGSTSTSYIIKDVVDNSTGVDVTHKDVPIQQLFNDVTVKVDTTYSYRVKAFNETASGKAQESEYSNAVSFTNGVAPDLYLEDHFTDFSKVFYMDQWATSNLMIDTGGASDFGNDANRVKRIDDQADAMTYKVDSDILSLVMDAYFDNGNAGSLDLTVQLSADGTSYDSLALSSNITDAGGNYYYKKVAYTATVDGDKGYRYLKIIFPQTGDGKPWAPQLGYMKVDLKD